MFDNFPLWPDRASTAAGNVDALFVFLLIVSGLMTALIFAALIYFAARYRRRRGVLAEQIEGSTPLELTWSIIPLFVFMVIFAWGAVVYFKGRTPPRDSTEVYVVAKQWMWKLEHAEGQREINELHVPVGRDVKLIMTSQDVIHSFYVPAFRMKQDVLPGRYTVAWFRATKPGTFHLFCAEYCGTEHSRMIGSVTVMEPADYEAWLVTGNPSPVEVAAGASAAPASAAGGGASGPTPVEIGAKLFQEKACFTCHLATPGGIGPILTHVPGSEVELASGDKVVADDAYLRESILTPMAKVVKGFPPAMPTFQGQLTEDQVMSLIAYVKSLGGAPGAPAAH